MKSYKSNDWRVVSGRGHIAIVDTTETPEPAVGEMVEIDGEQYKVIGIEKWAYNKNVGLIISGKQKIKIKGIK